MLNAIKNAYKTVACAHNYVFKRNMTDKESEILGGKKSFWMCSKCSKTELRDTAGGGQ